MENAKNTSFKVAFTLGTIAGMRTMMAPAILSHYLSRRPESGLTNTNLEFLRTSIFDKASKLLATGEVIGDKFPHVPDRISLGGLVGRSISGALVGAAIFRHENKKSWKGAIVGGVSSIASSFLFFYLRKKLGDTAHVEDKYIGAVEDALAVGSGVAMMSGNSTYNYHLN